jgi:glycine oxidase
MSKQGITDCIVIGGGLLGLMTARALCTAGARVALVERGGIFRESSWAGGGILSPLVPWQYPDAVHELVYRSQQVYPGLVDELLAETGIDSEWTRSGLLMTGIDADPAITAWAQAHDCRLESIAAAATASYEPQLAENPGPAILLPDVAQVRNPRLGRALQEALLRHGVRLHAHTEVTGFITRNGAVQGVTTRDGELPAAQVVVAGGAWSAPLLRDTGIELPVTPVRGQMIQFQARPGLLQHIVLHREHYLIPRNDGLVLAGSTLEHTGYDKSVTAAAREQLVQRALALVPALADYPVIRQWAGLRPGSPDGVPIIDEHPEIRGLYINTGHFRNGVVMAPASAQLLVDRMQQRESFTGHGPYTL